MNFELWNPPTPPPPNIGVGVTVSIRLNINILGCFQSNLINYRIPYYTILFFRRFPNIIPIFFCVKLWTSLGSSICAELFTVSTIKNLRYIYRQALFKIWAFLTDILSILFSLLNYREKFVLAFVVWSI